jgi:1-deoxyxylulose-5-phosphate synthase
MRHVRLGRTGLPVSRLCLGTMTFGLQCDEPASAAIMDRAAAGGITLVAVEKPIPADLKARLDELTREYRWGDDPR